MLSEKVKTTTVNSFSHDFSVTWQLGPSEEAVGAGHLMRRSDVGRVEKGGVSEET